MTDKLYTVTWCGVCLQFSDKFRGGRARWSDVWLSSLRCEVPHSTRPRLHADPRHVQAHQEGPTDQPSSTDGERGSRVPHCPDQPCRHPVPRVQRHPSLYLSVYHDLLIFVVWFLQKQACLNGWSNARFPPPFIVSALTVLTGHQEGHPACQNLLYSWTLRILEKLWRRMSVKQNWKRCSDCWPWSLQCCHFTARRSWVVSRHSGAMTSHTAQWSSGVSQTSTTMSSVLCF